MFVNHPTAEQFPTDAHDTELKYPLGVVFWIASAKTAGWAVAHMPAVDVMVNASSPLAVFLNAPTAVQLPADAHDTDSNCAIGLAFWIASAKTAGWAGFHVPAVDVMVNASLPPPAGVKDPTAVQLPADAHDTELNCALGVVFWVKSAKTARWALAQVPAVDVIVNAS